MMEEDIVRKRKRMMQDLDLLVVKADLSYQEARSLETEQTLVSKIAETDNVQNLSYRRAFTSVGWVVASYGIAYFVGHEEGMTVAEAVNKGFSSLVPDLMRLYGTITLGMGVFLNVGNHFQKKALKRLHVDLQTDNMYTSAKGKLADKGLEFP